MSDSLPVTNIAPQSNTQSSGSSVFKIAAIYLKSYSLILSLNASFLAVVGFNIADPTRHIGHLTVYGGFMAGMSGLFLLGGLCSAFKGHGGWITPCRVILLMVWVLQVLGMMSKDLPVTIVLVVAILCTFTLDVVYVKATSEAVKVSNTGGQLEGAVTYFSSFKRRVASITTTQLFSGTRAAPPASTSSHDLTGVDKQGSVKDWLSRMVRTWRQPISDSQAAEDSEKEFLLDDHDSV